MEIIIQNIDKIVYAIIAILSAAGGYVLNRLRGPSRLFNSKNGIYLSIRRVAEIGIIDELKRLSIENNKKTKWLDHLVLFRLYKNGTDKIRTELHIKNDKLINRTYSFLDSVPSPYYSKFFEEVEQYGKIEIGNTGDDRNFKRFSEFMLTNSIQSCVVIKLGKEMYLLIGSEKWRVYGNEINKINREVLKIQEAINIVFRYKLN